MRSKFTQFLLIQCLAALLLFPSLVLSQVQIGLKMGSNYANMDFEESIFTDNTERITSLTTAISIAIPINASLVIQPEFGFTGRGFQFPINFTGTIQEGQSLILKSTLNYLEFGSFILGQIGQKNTKLLIGAGPFLNYAVFGQSSLTGPLVTIEEDFITNLDLSNDINRWDLQLTAMLGISQRLGRLVGIIDFRYQQGLFNIVPSNSNNSNFVSDVPTYHQSFGWRAGIQIVIGRIK